MSKRMLSNAISLGLLGILLVLSFQNCGGGGGGGGGANVTFSNALLNGTYVVTTFGYESSVTQPNININIGSVPFSGTIQQQRPNGFQAELGTVTFDGNGNFTASFNKNTDGVSSIDSDSGTYTVTSSGKVVIDQIVAQLAPDGAGFILVSQAGVATIGAGIRKEGSSFSNATLDGDYVVTSYDFDDGPSQPQIFVNVPSKPMTVNLTQGRPNGFAADQTSVHFNGDGTYSMTSTRNQDGTTSNDSGNGTYSVASDGSVSIDGGQLVGQLSPDGSTFNLAKLSGSPNIALGIKKAGTFSNASLSGSYIVMTYQFDTGPTQPSLSFYISSTPYSTVLQQKAPKGFTASYGTVTFDGNGNYSASFKDNQDGVLKSDSDAGTYSVSPDGSFTASGNMIGQVAQDGKGAVLISLGGVPSIAWAIKP